MNRYNLTCRDVAALLIYFGFLAVVALSSGCISVDDPSVLTPVPTDTPLVTPADPTPTSEGPRPTIDCVPSGIYPLNWNPCPENYQTVHWTADTVQEIPKNMVLNVQPNANDVGTVPNITYTEGVMRLHTGGFVGRVGVQEHGLQLSAGHCYTFNVPVAINLLSSHSWENFSFYSTVHTDRSAVFDLNVHRAVIVQGTHAVLVGDYPDRIYWAFQPSRDMTIVWEVGFESTWATSAMGNHVDFAAFIVQEQDNTQICN